MADVTDVESALVAAIAQVIYPGGIGQPSVSGVPTVIYAGWPQSSQLDKDLAAFANGGTGRLHVTVFPNGTEKNTTRYSTDLQQNTANAPTLTLTISGQTITIGGAVSVPQNVALLVNNQPAVYAVQAGDTLTSVATALAAITPGATSAGAVITLPAGARINAARASANGTAYRELRRQNKVFQVTVWADTPAHRDVTAQPLDIAFAGMEFLTLPDGSGARLIYQSTKVDDATQRANTYRRDLLYTIEYATTQIVNTNGVIVTQENIGLGVTGNGNTLSSETIYQ